MRAVVEVRGSRSFLSVSCALAAAACLLPLVACHGDRAGKSDESAPAREESASATVALGDGAAAPATSCVVHLHGKGGKAEPPARVNGVLHLRPGECERLGGRQWLYFPDDRYAEVRAIVADAIAKGGCAKTVVHGFSNGASAAAALYCHGETFGGHLVGYLVDDPVPDHAVEGCRAPASVKLGVYTTGALAQATAGWSCASQDWTCAGGTTIGLAKYVEALGTTAQPSANKVHRELEAPPEYGAWL